MKTKLIIISLAVASAFMPSCRVMDKKANIAMACASDQSMNSADKKEVMVAAMQRDIGPDGKPAFEWPTFAWAWEDKLNMPVLDKDGNPCFYIGPDGNPVVHSGGWLSSGVQGNKDVMGEIRNLALAATTIKASDNYRKASDTKEVEATKRAASADAVKKEKILSNERIKTFVPPEPETTTP